MEPGFDEAFRLALFTGLGVGVFWWARFTGVKSGGSFLASILYTGSVVGMLWALLMGNGPLEPIALSGNVLIWYLAIMGVVGIIPWELNGRDSFFADDGASDKLFQTLRYLDKTRKERDIEDGKQEDESKKGL